MTEVLIGALSTIIILLGFMIMGGVVADRQNIETQKIIQQKIQTNIINAHNDIEIIDSRFNEIEIKLKAMENKTDEIIRRVQCIDRMTNTMPSIPIVNPERYEQSTEVFDMKQKIDISSVSLCGAIVYPDQEWLMKQR